MQNVPTQGPKSNLIISFYFAKKMLPMLIAAFTIYLGYHLFILGVTGEASLSIDTKTVEGQLINAAPGLFFAIGGIIALTVSIWKGVKISFDSDGNI